MDNNLLQAISIAGFFHDIGKFAERAYAVDPGNIDDVQQDYRYAHAHHTELSLKALFPEERLIKIYGGERECTILNMAARHHKPRNIYELFVSEADRIASGHERAEGDDASDYDTGGREKKSKTPLSSILARIRLKKYIKDPVTDWRYRIREASLAYEGGDQTAIFPVRKEEYQHQQVQPDYKKQWTRFCRAIKPSADFGLDIIDNFSTIFEICKEYQWCLPASTRKEELPDVSLFDHQKVTAALAACLYYYHAKNNSLSEKDIRKRKTNTYLLFCGDISGIQNFIYQISSKGAYRTLKGKSFYIQILAEILAMEFIEKFRMTMANVLYASGGKFYLMLPNTDDVRDKLDILKDEINKELLDRFNGDLFIRTGYRAISGDDLTRQSGRTLYQIWDELTRQLIYEDRQRYANQAAGNYNSLFRVEHGSLETCQVCHRTMKQGAHKSCLNCREMEDIGAELSKASYIIIGRGKNDLDTSRFVFRFKDRYVWFEEKLPVAMPGNNLLVWTLNSADFSTIPLRQKTGAIINAAPFIAGSTHRFDQTFDKIASMSDGIERLGVLRMDVDNLGKIFSEGLENYKHGQYKRDTMRFHSLGRITTLSWQLCLFFGGILPGLIRQNPDWADRVTVVYSGGDDLFLLGAWDALPDVALEIKEKFTAFSCDNHSFSLSGGMVITGGRFPIYKSADMAGEAEEKAKLHTTFFEDTEKVKKNSFTFLDTPMHWREFSEIARYQKQLLAILQDKKCYPLLTRLRDIAVSWQESHDRLCRSGGSLSIETIRNNIMAEKWRWRMVYTLFRFAENHVGMKEDIEDLQQFIIGKVAGTTMPGIELLGILCRWCELRLR